MEVAVAVEDGVKLQDPVIVAVRDVVGVCVVVSDGLMD